MKRTRSPVRTYRGCHDRVPHTVRPYRGTKEERFRVTLPPSFPVVKLGGKLPRPGRENENQPHSRTLPHSHEKGSLDFLALFLKTKRDNGGKVENIFVAGYEVITYHWVTQASNPAPQSNHPSSVALTQVLPASSPSLPPIPTNPPRSPRSPLTRPKPPKKNRALSSNTSHQSVVPIRSLVPRSPRLNLSTAPTYHGKYPPLTPCFS